MTLGPDRCFAPASSPHKHAVDEMKKLDDSLIVHRNP